jgi:hypothetical protein
MFSAFSAQATAYGERAWVSTGSVRLELLSDILAF